MNNTSIHEYENMVSIDTIMLTRRSLALTLRSPATSDAGGVGTSKDAHRRTTWNSGSS